MKPCNDKIKLTPEEEKLLNESVFKILCDGLDIVRARFPNIHDALQTDEQTDTESDRDKNLSD